MDKREKVIKGLECCMGDGIEDTPGCEECPYNDMGDTCDLIRPLYEDARELLKKSFTPDEASRAVIEHGQHDRRFRLGDPINYSFPEVIDILRIEVMCKAGDM